MLGALNPAFLTQYQLIIAAAAHQAQQQQQQAQAAAAAAALAATPAGHSAQLGMLISFGSAKILYLIE